MLQPGTTDLEKTSVVVTIQSNEPPSTLVETTEQLVDQTDPLNTGTLSSLLPQQLCTACKLPFIYDQYSISNPHRRKITCLGCNKLFSYISKKDMCQKLQNIENGNMNSIGDKESHLNFYHLHRSTNNDLYHFPLSPDYYIKQVNKDNQEQYTHCTTNEHSVEAYCRYLNCIAFVKRKRKTLKTATQKALGSGVAGFDQLMEFMVKSNATCALTGIKGSWSSIPGDPMYLLSLDHTLPLYGGGSSEIDNLQVTLQCFINVKGDYKAEDFKRWFTAIKQMPKYKA